jgi:hypothetical protein
MQMEFNYYTEAQEMDFQKLSFLINVKGNKTLFSFAKLINLKIYLVGSQIINL